MNEYLTPDQLCELVPGTTKTYWAQLRFYGKGPKYLKPSPRKVLYIKSEIIEWLENSARYGTHPDKVAS
ncbi:AlpA family transcriptional regulator [Aurantimicrobium sp. MWH-Uga1]|uniref:helix-turn-helix transcriptional regulator n=1 Tax=Aurantimicrobium sp. MWH-Uga1 TaxID=2079575 RepID=UPI000DED8811|nr:hypothetical protein [Aurantimicrobium sp. MWH-Uga1]AXE54077.1 hypothetical protein AURUGA1_00370 [Aurantimicrobium sp. MWH-Uga1]